MGRRRAQIYTCAVRGIEREDVQFVDANRLIAVIGNFEPDGGFITGDCVPFQFNDVIAASERNAIIASLMRRGIAEQIKLMRFVARIAIGDECSRVGQVVI